MDLCVGACMHACGKLEQDKASTVKNMHIFLALEGRPQGARKGKENIKTQEDGEKAKLVKSPSQCGKSE